MPFKVLNSRTVIIAGKCPSEKIQTIFLNYFYLLLLNKVWKDIPKNKVDKIYELLDINANSSLRFSKDIVFLSPRMAHNHPGLENWDIFVSCNLNDVQRIEKSKVWKQKSFLKNYLKRKTSLLIILPKSFRWIKSIESFFTKPNKNSFSFKH